MLRFSFLFKSRRIYYVTATPLITTSRTLVAPINGTTGSRN